MAPLRAAQALGEAALLVRAALEAAATCSRCLGHRFAANGRLLRCVLLPLLERLGDPCALVATAAQDAAAAIAHHCG